MEDFGVAAGVVALAEIGDKTQLLALLLAARYRAPWPIVGGILVATVLNHALAGVVGSWVQAALGEQVLRIVLALLFGGMALWVLVPDQLDESDRGAAQARSRWGPFAASLVAFFLAEMGDKTQLVTVALAAHYASLWAVVAGTTLGMMLANVPAVFLGERVTRLSPVVWVHRLAAVLFAAMAVAVAWGVGSLGKV